MRAIQKLGAGPGNLGLVELPEPHPAPGQVEIKVHACGICGSDMKFYHWSMRPGMGIRPPVTLGHEFAGIIEAVGEGVSRWRVGDRVTAETPAFVCGHCEQCQSGEGLLCREKRSIGYQCDGAMAEYICIREEIVHRVPDSIPLDEAAACEPCCVAQHAVFDQTRVLPGETVVVIGPGPIGLLALQMVKACGARAVLVGLPADESRLALGKALGADDCLTCCDTAALPGVVRALTAGRGADHIIECSGAVAALDAALVCCKKKGTVVEVALFRPGELPLANLNLLVNNELTLRGAYGHRHANWERSLALMASGALRVAPLLTHRFSFEEHLAAFETAAQQQGVKVLLKP